MRRKTFDKALQRGSVMMASAPDDTWLDEARGYLSDYLADEEIHGNESQEWFGELGEYVARLPLDDQLITKAAVYLEPFLDDDERVECAMYPGGEAVKFIAQGWGGDHRAYLTGFVDAMGRDHARWQAMLRDVGEGARWTLS
jgi:hypothetical protein